MTEYERHLEPSLRAEQRMLAVARLRRAASLPRMKDGRRPPMHVEAVSEGEKAASEGEKSRSNSDSPPPVEIRFETQQIHEKEDVAVESFQEAQREVEVDIEADNDAEVEERAVSPVTRAKRRSRSRSRSRNSMKGRARQPPGLTLGGDSSQDEGLPPFITLPMVPLLSPTPSHFATLQNPHLLGAPAPASPDPLSLYPGVSPSSALAMLPTLEAIQKGLIRSHSVGNSATVGRRMALHKLTGGREIYDPSPSPTPSPHFEKLSRNNTVSGGERVAARQFMLSRLGGRITKEAELEQASGGEERHRTSPTPRRRRRRSRRGSSSAAISVVPETEHISPPNTPTPLPYALDALRAQSATPSQATSPRRQSFEQVEELPLTTEENQFARRRSVVVEEDDEFPPEPRQPNPLPLPSLATPIKRLPSQTTALRLPQSSDAPSIGSLESTSSNTVGVPLFLSPGAPSRSETLPSSPFNTPLMEKPVSDDDEEQVLYHANTYHPRTPHSANGDPYNRQISWVASPEIRMPIDDIDEDEDTQPQQVEERDDKVYDRTPPSATLKSTNVHRAEDGSPHMSADWKSVAIESDASLELNPSLVPASSSSGAALVQQSVTSVTHTGEDSTSPPSYPARLSAASRIQGDRSPAPGDSTDWEERILNGELSKRNAEQSSASTWDKLKSTFARSGSNSGHRSRSNSVATRERRDYTDSSVSRESGASLVSAKTDRGDSMGGPGTRQSVQLMQSPSASASILSLTPHVPPHGSASPIPPASSADLLRYQNAKLFPFPGMRKLEEQRNRAKGVLSASCSTPDITSLSNAVDDILTPISSNSHQASEVPKEGKLSHQASDTRISGRYHLDASSSQSPSSPGHPDYFQVHPPASPQTGGSLSLKLPMTLPGVKQWLSKNNKKKPQSVQNSSPSSLSPSLIVVTPYSTSYKKPTLSDLLKRKDADLGADWEDVRSMSTSIVDGPIPGKQQSAPEPRAQTQMNPPNNGPTMSRSETDHENTPKAKKTLPLDHTFGREAHTAINDSPSSRPSRAEQIIPPTPEPASSYSDYPAASTSESSSSTSSQYSIAGFMNGEQGSDVMERLEDLLTKGLHSPVWVSAIDDPPRKLLLSSPVLQVVNSNTVKDRFLFLFSDVLVIAKPILQDHDNSLENYKPSPLDRKYIVKSVVHLRDLHFGPDRTEVSGKAIGNAQNSRNALISSFVSQFSEDPGTAISTLFSKSNSPVDPLRIGQLLFRTIGLDRAKLGEYLARRQSRLALKSYLDSFELAGLRIDKALRVFLLSVHVSSRSSSLEYLLDAFASRWYEANAKIVAYDRDMAVRLVRALVQLNELLHDGIADDITSSPAPKHKIQCRDFVDAFRRYDVRYRVPDELLEEVFQSIHQVRLCQARNPAANAVDLIITFKRPLPSRLTYKVQSEPIVLRIPQADPKLILLLYGQDLTFDPPVLTFAKSSEVSFRVSGTSLGLKTMIICRSGPNALKYAGLPLSNSIVVERAFMRNTFQLAFMNRSGMKRRYMFSVDDPLIRHQWAVSLKREIENVTTSPNTPAWVSSLAVSEFLKAAESIAFQVLQEKLMGPLPSSARQCSANDNQHGSNDSADQSTSSHARSKSRSHYYNREAGKTETELSRDVDAAQHGVEGGGEYPATSSNEAAERVEGPLWSGRDLRMHCLQSSSVPLVLSFLQFGTPDLEKLVKS